MACCISISLECNKSIIKGFKLPAVASTFDTLSIVSTSASKGSGRDNFSLWGQVFVEFQLMCRGQPMVISLFTLLINAGFFYNPPSSAKKEMPFQPE